MALRMSNQLSGEGSGYASFILMYFASRYFNEAEVLATLLPPLSPDTSPESVPKRRSVFGYYELARRVGSLLLNEQVDLDWSGLKALSSGLWILALTENIKAQVLERLQRLSADDLSPFENFAWVGIFRRQFHKVC